MPDFGCWEFTVKLISVWYTVLLLLFFLKSIQSENKGLPDTIFKLLMSCYSRNLLCLVHYWNNVEFLLLMDDDS